MLLYALVSPNVLDDARFVLGEGNLAETKDAYCITFKGVGGTLRFVGQNGFASNRFQNADLRAMVVCQEIVAEFAGKQEVSCIVDLIAVGFHFGKCVFKCQGLCLAFDAKGFRFAVLGPAVSDGVSVKSTWGVDGINQRRGHDSEISVVGLVLWSGTAAKQQRDQKDCDGGNASCEEGGNRFHFCVGRDHRTNVEYLFLRL